MHVYASLGFKTWICSGKPLTVLEIYEAEAQAKIDSESGEAAKQALLHRLLTEGEGEALIAERLQGRNDKETASSDICQALDLWQPYKQNPSWAVVKEHISVLRRNRQATSQGEGMR